jgi:hypothetical protein
MTLLHITRIWPTQEALVNLKTFLLAVTAAVAIFGAAVVGVPTTSDKPERSERIIIRSD